MTAVEVLEQNEWTRGAPARRVDGGSCSPHDDRAVAFCAAGAVFRAYPDDKDRNAAWQRVVEAAGLLSLSAVFRWNDEPGRTKAEAVELLRKAGV